LHRERGVRHFWLADENPTTDRELWRTLLEELAARRLGVTISCTLRAADVVRDADLAPLMRRAGVSRVLLGVEAVTNEVLARVGKRARADDATRAIRILRRHGILTNVDVIFGLEEESLGSLWRTLRGLLRDDGDFLNALYVTPYAWTPVGRELRAADVHEADLRRWDYRHPVLAPRRLSPASLFLAVKAIELVYHLRPSRLVRAAVARDPATRRYYRYCDSHAGAVFLHELGEFLLDRMAGRSARRRNSSVETFHRSAGSWG
jgi:anaerobic magnesium-protoporphyrin IX monomethyl ester cyclase